MQMKDYFENTEGTGVMSTADGQGKVDAAIYARPHVTEDGTLAFIMRDRLTHSNLKENPYAAYLFMEKGGGYKGVRMFLKKVKEDTDSELIEKMTRRCLSPEEDAAKGPKFAVYFEIEKTLDLIGSGSPDFA
ncbi:MAG TPA: pyridoxamine 5'-phosphate oxidase family protein [Desulfuromonadales bacterium]|nr:pyridoxamine 5'-phosphate oxidase family protein [Desulfuromonadales bacterium]